MGGTGAGAVFAGRDGAAGLHGARRRGDCDQRRPDASRTIRNARRHGADQGSAAREPAERRSGDSQRGRSARAQHGAPDVGGGADVRSLGRCRPARLRCRGAGLRRSALRAPPPWQFDDRAHAVGWRAPGDDRARGGGGRAAGGAVARSDRRWSVVADAGVATGSSLRAEWGNGDRRRLQRRAALDARGARPVGGASAAPRRRARRHAGARQRGGRRASRDRRVRGVALRPVADGRPARRRDRRGCACRRAG